MSVSPEDVVEIPVAGIVHHALARSAVRPHEGQEVVLHREPHNAADRNAVAVVFGGVRLGYLPRRFAATLAPQLDHGVRCTAHITQAPSFSAAGTPEAGSLKISVQGVALPGFWRAIGRVQTGAGAHRL